MTLEQLKGRIISTEPSILAHELMEKRVVAALANEATYTEFRLQVRRELSECESVCVVGSGNWGYSLNPEKLWRPFGTTSDVDVAVISRPLYFSTWAIIRQAHRKQWYALSYDERENLRRNGQNIYCGFVSPLWIPVWWRHKARYRFKSILNKLSGSDVGYRQVNIMYFRNMTEAVDYYQRGFSLARRRIQDEI